jgi:hypothetical protein
LAFFVYRLVNPSAAKDLLQDMKSFSNDKFWTDFVITTQLEELTIETWTVLEETGVLVTNDSELQELNDEDELLLSDELIEENFWANETTPIEEEVPQTPPTTPSVPVATPPTTTTTTTTVTTKPSSNDGISKQDLIDFKTLFGN